MDYVGLQELLQNLCYGTHLHVGVIPLGRYGNKKLDLPHEQTIHASAVCEHLKGKSLQSYEKCHRCRNTAIQKAIVEKKAFGGLCVNGIYEYMHPVIDGGTVQCIIYIGNILQNGSGTAKLCRRLGKHVYLTDTMEANCSEERCASMARTIESYIHMLSEKYVDRSDANEQNLLIENTKRYLQSNLSHEISIASVAALFHYNEKYLGRLFKQNTGKSFGAYANEKRIAHAKRLLEETEASVIEISGRVGFNNVTYFTRVFKNRCGVTPSIYRKEHKKHR